MNLHILALETSSSVCGVSLLSRIDGQESLRTHTHDATGEHAERLLPMVEDLLVEAGIRKQDPTAVGFGQGPGGFTGLRVACGIAQGIGFALGVPVIPVGSLLAVAVRASEGHPDNAPSSAIVALQDARMGEVYLAAYRPVSSASGQSWCELQAPILIGAQDVGPWLTRASHAWAGNSAHPVDTVRLVGDALDVHPELVRGLPTRIQPGQALRPDAPTVARLSLSAWQRGLWVAPELAAPLYVRDKVAYTTEERQRGHGGNPKAPPVVDLMPMAAEHLDDVAAIEASVQAFPWTRRNFDDGLQAGYSAWVARRENRIVGFCMVMFAPDVAHVLVIAVQPSEQGKGVGGLLIRQCEREAQARGLPALILEVRPSNENAVAFYRRQGFVSLGVRKDYYPAPQGRREDAWVMEKKLMAAAGHG